MIEKKKILIVDDERDFVEMLKVRLESSGYEVDVAYDGQEGLDKARHDKPDLVVLDVMMPLLDGYHVCRLLKFDEQFNQIPVIILTARGRPEDRETGEDVGGDAYMVKPFDSKELLSKIQELLNR